MPQAPLRQIMAEVTLHPSLLPLLLAEGIGEAEIQDMVHRSAIHSGDGCNRRFHNWLFAVQDGQLVKMMTLEYRTIGRAYQGTGQVEEECLKCEGRGCKFCGWRGVVQRNVPYVGN